MHRTNDLGELDSLFQKLGEDGTISTEKYLQQGIITKPITCGFHVDSKTYGELLSYVRQRVYYKKKNGFLQNVFGDPEDILQDVFLVMAENNIDFGEVKKQIIKRILHLQHYPRAIYINMIDEFGEFIKPRYYEDDFAYCKCCKEVKSVNQFRIINRYEFGLLNIRDDKCTVCHALNFNNYYHANNGKMRKYNNSRFASEVKNLSDSYIKKALRNSGEKEITPEMIIKKRQQIFDKRKLKEETVKAEATIAKQKVM